MKTAVLFFLVLFGSIYLQGQDHFLVEFEAFTPPEKELIKNYKGFPAEAFLAADTDGTEHFLNDYRGKVVILWFWSSKDEVSSSWLAQMNLLQIQYLEELKVFGFATEKKDEIIPILDDNAVVFSNIPNSTVFAEMAYGGDLGLGRMFLIDKNGIIREIIPRSYIESKRPEELISAIETAVKTLIFNR